MSYEKDTCVVCNAELNDNESVCPQCGAEQPVTWMVYIVYALVALFILGVIYRLIWP